MAQMFKRRGKAQCGGDYTHNASLLPAVNQVYLCINNGIVEHRPKYRGGSENFVLLINGTKISKRAF